MNENVSFDEQNIEQYIQNHVVQPLSTSTNTRPDTPKDIVLFGFGRIGRLITRIMAEKTGPGNYYKLKAIVVRKGSSENDLLKRASLLRRDSVHGAFSGTIRVDTDNDLLVVNGNPIKLLYADSPDELNYSDFDIIDPILIDNTGAWTDEEGLNQHIKNPSVERAILTAPAKGKIKNIVYGINCLLYTSDAADE